MKVVWRFLVLLGVTLLTAGCGEWGPTGYERRDGEIVWMDMSGRTPTEMFSHREWVVDADFETFRIESDDRWATDHQNAFYQGWNVGPVDQDSFEIVDRYTARDRNSVWREGRLVEGVESSSYEWLGARYSRDRNAIYFVGRPMEVCDPDSFTVVSDAHFAFGLDRECVFYEGLQVPIRDRESFEIIAAGYSRDQYQVYWGDTALNGADVDSFYVPAGMMYGVDEEGCWIGAIRRPCRD